MTIEQEIFDLAARRQIHLVDAAEILIADARQKLYAFHEQRNYADLTASNIYCQSQIHKKTMRLIMQLTSQSLGVHPHYEESYPAILKHLEDTYFVENAL